LLVTSAVPAVLSRPGPRALALLTFALLSPPAADAAEPSAAPTPIVVDRVAARFSAPEIGGSSTPMFVFERELAFEARLEAAADRQFSADLSSEPYSDRHLRLAFERHVAETLLSKIPIDPEPTAAELTARVTEARIALYQTTGGPRGLDVAQAAEGLGAAELTALLTRRARASLYLDRMVTPVLEASIAELRAAHSAGQSPYSEQPFASALPFLRRWYLAQRLSSAVRAFYEGARSRLRVDWVIALPGVSTDPSSGLVP
jgi:hypothetical protein